MAKQRLLIVSDSPSNFEDSVNEVNEKLEAKGCKTWGPTRYPTAPFNQMRRVVYSFKDPDKPKHRWLEFINTTIGDGLSRNGPTRIYGCGFGIQARVDVTGDSVINTANLPEGTYSRVFTESNSQTGHSHRNAPFSYDPAQDYYTEPER